MKYDVNDRMKSPHGQRFIKLQVQSLLLSSELRIHLIFNLSLGSEAGVIMKMPIKVNYVDHGDFFEHMALLSFASMF
jgi:hypothetical protein